MIRALRLGHDTVRHNLLLAWCGLAFASFSTAWLVTASTCDTTTCYWGLAAMMSVAGGVVLALARPKESVKEARADLAVSIDAVAYADWQRVVPADNPYMQLPYLRALERAGASMRYVVAYRDGQPVAAASFQVLELDRDTVLRPEWRLPVRMVFSSLFERGHARALILGNALHSWTGSFAHVPSLPEEEAGRLLADLARRVRRAEQGGGISFTVLRDVELGTDGMDSLDGAGYMPLTGVEPTMVVPLDPSWRGPADYAAAMSRKYRARLRRSRKKAAGLAKKDLTLQELLAQRAALEPLLDGVVDRADFKLARCSLDDVVELKRGLGDRFIVRTYLDGEQVVGFGAALAHESRLEALLVGIDYDVNREVGLYQNMLYDFVEMGIERGCEQVHLGRTALEIKSTVGAVARPLPILVRHRNPLVNKAVAVALRFVDDVTWTPRNPFPEPS